MIEYSIFILFLWMSSILVPIRIALVGYDCEKEGASKGDSHFMRG